MVLSENDNLFVNLEIPHWGSRLQPIPELRGELLSYASQLGTALHNTLWTTVIQIIDHTRARVISGIWQNQLWEIIHSWASWLTTTTAISKFNLWKFDAKELFRYFTRNIKPFPIVHRDMPPVDFVKTNFGGEEVNDIPIDILAEITGWSKTGPTYNFWDAFRAQLKDQFKTQTLQHEGVILIKAEHYDTNTLFSFVSIVQSEDEIENEYLRETGDKEKHITFLWVEQAKFFQALIQQK